MLVLARQSWSGHEVTFEDVKALLGEQCIKIIGKQTITKLLMWLKANKRTEFTFKLSHQLTTEIGKIYFIIST